MKKQPCFKYITTSKMVLEDDCMALLVVPSFVISAFCATQNLTTPTIALFSVGVLGIIGSCSITFLKEMEKIRFQFFLEKRETVKY